MRLNDPLMTEITYEGQKYPIDLAFDNVLDVFDVLNDSELISGEKLELVLILLIGETDLPVEKKIKLWSMILNQCILLGEKAQVPKDIKGNPLPAAKKAPKTIDLIQDAKYIYASFRQIGINLFQQQGKLTWEEFQALLESLPEETILSKIVQIREWKPQKGDNAKERERMRKLQAKYALKEEVEQ